MLNMLKQPARAAHRAEKGGINKMTKFLIKSILVISLVLIMGSRAGAWVDDTSYSQLFCADFGLCSIRANGLLKGLGNVNNNTTFFTVNILIQEGTIVIANKGGNTGGTGIPFGPVTVTLTESALINAAQVS